MFSESNNGGRGGRGGRGAGMRRAKSHYSIRATHTAGDSEDSDDDSISDISMDTCFRFQRDDEEFTDESEEDDVLQKKRSYRHSDPSFNQNMMVVTPSFRKKQGIGSMLSKRHLSGGMGGTSKRGQMQSLTMEDIDASKQSDFLRFDKADFLQTTTSDDGSKPRKRQSATMQRKSQSSFEDLSEIRDFYGKAKEFEDVDKKLTSSQRHLQEFNDITQDPFLSGDEEFAALGKKRRKKKKKSSKKEGGSSTTSNNNNNNNNKPSDNEASINWDEVDAKASLAAYSVAEGNIYPEIPGEDKRKFRRSGNAWLEGRYSNNVDWKRNATGMVLDVPGPSPRKNDQPKLARPEGSVTDRIKDRPKQSTGRTELSIAAPAAGATQEDEEELPIPAPLPELIAEPPAPPPPARPSFADRRTGFLRANSMPSFKLGAMAQRAFKRMSTANSSDESGDDLGSLPEADNEDAELSGHNNTNEPASSTFNSDELLHSSSSPMVDDSAASARSSRESPESKGPSSARRRSDAMNDVSDGGKSSSKSKSKKSSKKEGKTSKGKEGSERGRRSSIKMEDIVADAEEAKASLRRIKSVETGTTEKRTKSKPRTNGMEVIGENSEPQKVARLNDTTSPAKPAQGLRRIKSLEPTSAIPDASPTMQDSGHGNDFFVLELPTRKMRFVSDESANSNNRSPQVSRSPPRRRTHSLDTDDIDCLPSEPTFRQRKGVSRRRQSYDHAGYQSPDEADVVPDLKSNSKARKSNDDSEKYLSPDECFDTNVKRVNGARRRRSNDSKDSNSIRTQEYSTRTQDPRNEIPPDDFVSSPCNDFIAHLDAPLKTAKLNRPNYSGSSGDESSSHKRGSRHRRRTASVSSDDASESKHTKRRSRRRGSVERSRTSRRTSHASVDLEEVAEAVRSSENRSPRKSSSAEALEEIISMSSRLHNSSTDFSGELVDEVKLIRQRSHDGGVDDLKKVEKKQRKKDKRRSSSVPKVRPEDVEAAIAAAAKQLAKEEQMPKRGSTHRRRSSTSIPRRADEAEARDGERRKGATTVETPNRDVGSSHERRSTHDRRSTHERGSTHERRSSHDRGSTHRRRRGSSVPRSAVTAAANIAGPAVATAGDGDQTPEGIHRPGRRRSLTPGGDFVTADLAPPTPVRERNESHQYVGFTGSRTTDDAPPAAAAPGKLSFLARFAKLEHETIPKPTAARRSVMQRAQSERSFKYNGQALAKNFTPTFKELPGTKQTATPTAGAYSDMVMQGKIGFTAGIAES